MADHQTDKLRVSRSGRILKKTFKLKEMEETLFADAGEKGTETRNKSPSSSSGSQPRKVLRDLSNSKPPRSTTDALGECCSGELPETAASPVDVIGVSEGEGKEDLAGAVERSGKDSSKARLFRSSEEIESSSSRESSSSTSSSSSSSSTSSPAVVKSSYDSDTEVEKNDSRKKTKEADAVEESSENEDGSPGTSDDSAAIRGGASRMRKRKSAYEADPEYVVSGSRVKTGRSSRKITATKKPRGSSSDAKLKKRNSVGRLPANSYALWRKVNWKKIRAACGGLNRHDLFRKVGEAWRSLPSSEKALWKKKARRMSLMRSSSVFSRKTNAAAVSAEVDFLTPEEQASIGIAPTDSAARLKLLGNSLTALGLKIVSLDCEPNAGGVYSVLLDSLLCSMVPLLCLSREIPGLEDLPGEAFFKMCDHIAYFLPGL